MPEKSVNMTSWEPVSQYTLGLKVNMDISNLEGFRRSPSECELLTMFMILKGVKVPNCFSFVCLFIF